MAKVRSASHAAITLYNPLHFLCVCYRRNSHHDLHATRSKLSAQKCTHALAFEHAHAITKYIRAPNTCTHIHTQHTNTMHTHSYKHILHNIHTPLSTHSHSLTYTRAHAHTHQHRSQTKQSRMNVYAETHTQRHIHLPDENQAGVGGTRYTDRNLPVIPPHCRCCFVCYL